jgi:tetratricopeptide (TPR) repeat protein
MGDALLKVKNNPQGALASFREGLRDDPHNAEVYAGLDAAMSLTGASAAERAATLSQYPSADVADSKMPADLVYQLALTRAEAMQFERAQALFKNRFLASEEGGITPAEVRFEIGLMQADTWAKAHNCTAAQGFLTEETPGMILDGRSARQYVMLAEIARSCGQAKQQDDLLHKAAAQIDLADLAWAIRAEKLLGTYNAETADELVAKALAAAESRAETGASSGSWWYNIGLLEAGLKRNEDARRSFDKTLILPDTHMSHHLAREALIGLSGGK